jgi:Mn2+/Fe2+ NRAMP family transporter
MAAGEANHTSAPKRTEFPQPVKALFLTAVINGVVAVPLMIVMMFLARRRDIMGGFVLSRWLSVFGWLATALMTGAVAIMFATWSG